MLEEIAARQERGNAKLYELNTALADLNEKAHTLQRLHNKGFIEDADFREQSDALASQRKKLTDQRTQAIHGSKALETLDKLRELQEQLLAASAGDPLGIRHGPIRPAGGENRAH